jgi:hypothetical protein
LRAVTGELHQAAGGIQVDAGLARDDLGFQLRVGVVEVEARRSAAWSTA